jgi:hypothetical protein
MKPGDIVHYHLNASAHECSEDANGQEAIAIVRTVKPGPTGPWVSVHLENTDYVKVDCAVGEGPGCVSAIEVESPAEVPAAPIPLQDVTELPEEPRQPNGRKARKRG